MTTSAKSAPRRIAGRYLLGAVLGRGAMGTVWAAQDEVLGRAVAIKEVLLAPGLPNVEADLLRERSLREARAIAALSHPNVVTLYDIVREGEAPYVVMELVASQSLATLLHDGPLPPRRVAAVGVAVAAALQAAHAAGITHRDVKPGNVLMAHDGRIKLTDFGIARNRADQTMTATGLLLGSPAYIAPEVASGRGVSPAADLWGLGATLFAAAEGKPPYDAGDPMATVALVVLNEVPAPTCSGPLAEVIRGLMVKDPARRMPLSEVRRILGTLLVAQPAAAEPIIPANPATTAASAPPFQPSLAGPPAGPPVRQLAADPGPLPFLGPARLPVDDDVGIEHSMPASARRAPSARSRETFGTVMLWTLAMLLFLGSAATGFGLARASSGATVLPEVNFGAQPGLPWGNENATLVARRLQVAEENGSRPATFSVDVPPGWPEFRERGVLGGDSGIVVRFVSPDGAQLIAVERAPGFLATGTAETYLATYRRELREAGPELVQTSTAKLTGGGLDATLRTREGAGTQGELRRTSYVRLVPAGRDLWMLRVVVPTDQEHTALTELFEPVVAGFTVHG